MEQTDNLFMQYIDTIDVVQKRINLSGMYKWIKDYENNYGVDVLQFDDNMIVHMLNSQIGLSVSTARRYIDDLNGFFKWAVEVGHIPVSPMRSVTYRHLDFTRPIQKNVLQIIMIFPLLYNGNGLLTKERLPIPLRFSHGWAYQSPMRQQSCQTILTWYAERSSTTVRMHTAF